MNDDKVDRRTQVPVDNDQQGYSWYPGPHHLVDDDGNVVGAFPAIKEVPLTEQKFTTIKNIRVYCPRKEDL